TEIFGGSVRLARARDRAQDAAFFRGFHRAVRDARQVSQPCYVNMAGRQLSALAFQAQALDRIRVPKTARQRSAVAVWEHHVRINHSPSDRSSRRCAPELSKSECRCAQGMAR